MRLRALAAGMLLATSAHALTAQSVTIRSLGPSIGGRMLQSVLSAPHRVVAPGSGDVMIARGANENTSLVVLGAGRATRIAGTVHGDVVVIGGDLYIHPGAHIDGRAIALGGGAYHSTLAIVSRGYFEFLDFTYDVQSTAGGYVLDYRPLAPPPAPPVTLSGIYGFGAPGYDRSDGVSLPFGLDASADSGRLQASASATYRSQLGRLDPSLTAELQPNQSTRFEAFAGRGTFTNEGWIWSDLVNSAAAFALGIDSRNWYRADRAQIVGHYTFATKTSKIEPLIGFRTERAWSVRPDSGATGGPWSVLGRSSVHHMLRPNPRVDEGTITCALVGGDWSWQGSGGVALGANVTSEIATSSPLAHGFVQTTLDATVGFPTFTNQRFDLQAHWLTSSDSTPRQRWAYVGGSGTLPFLGLLSEGGDELLFVESAYTVPIAGINIPIAGQPSLQLRHLLGAAGVRHLPLLEQNVGVRLILSFLRVDVMVDPARGKVRPSLGLTLAR